jgi:hypothetical protein
MIHTFWGSLCAVRLHRDVRVQVVQRSVGLLATIPATLVHAFNLLVTPARTLVLLRAGDWNKRVDRRQWVPTLDASLALLLRDATRPRCESD